MVLLCRTNAFHRCFGCGHSSHVGDLVLNSSLTDIAVIGSALLIVGSIDNQGNVTGVSKGNATVTIVASNGVSANCEITVLEDNLLLGDVNNDNLINYSDAVILLQADSKLIELTELQKSVADVNKDKIVDYNDAVQILRYDAGIITGFE